MYQWIVFIDFDGTITSEETFTGALTRLDPPDLYACYEKMLTQEMTISAGAHHLFSQVPSSDFHKLEAYIRTVPLREGLREFLARMHDENIPVVVVSGGIRQAIDIALAPYKEYLHAVHAVDLDLSGETMRLVSECDDGTELLKKNAVLDQYDYQQCVCIGDGYTDFTMSARGDFVCARDQLADYLFENNMPFAPWDDFFDILRALEDAGILSKKND